MTDLIESWQYYDFLFPEQSLPYVLLIGLVLSIFLSSNKTSILNLAYQSNSLLFDNQSLNKAYLNYQSGFVYFWLILISALTASMAYLIFKLGTFISIWLGLLIQILLAWQIFPVKRYLDPLLNSRQTFNEEGTMLGLAQLRKNLDTQPEQNTIIEMYHITLHDYLMQVTLYWFIPFIILYFGFWPFAIFYLSFIIQYQNFNLQNRVIDLILSIFHIVVTGLMRILFLFCQGNPFEKNEFKNLFLSFENILLSNQTFLEKIELDSDSELSNNQEIADREKNIMLNKYQRINLNYLNYVEILCLGSMTLIAVFALLIYYLRANLR